jgi:hypothetical protein
MTLRNFIVASGTLLLAVMGSAVLWLKTFGLSARTTPSTTETRVARSIRHFAIPAAARDERNPLRPTSEMLDAEGFRELGEHGREHATNGQDDADDWLLGNGQLGDRESVCS